MKGAPPIYTGKLHARERVAFVRDPQIAYGPFRVMRRTDGALIVVDERLPLAEKTVFAPTQEAGAADEKVRLEWCRREAERRARAEGFTR